jgi:hypothetical protein
MLSNEENFYKRGSEVSETPKQIEQLFDLGIGF